MKNAKTLTQQLEDKADAELSEKINTTLEGLWKDLTGEGYVEGLPEVTINWLRVNEPDMRRPVVDMLRCPLCGDWFTSIDHLAPYHWETCWCAKCQKYPMQPESVIPRSNDPSSATAP